MKGKIKIPRGVIAFACEQPDGSYNVWHHPSKKQQRGVTASDLVVWAKLGWKVVVSLLVPAHAIADIVVTGKRVRWVIRPATAPTP